MTVTVNTALQNEQVDAWGTDLDLGFIDIYEGGIPAANDPPLGTLLVTIDLAADAYAAAATGAAVNNGTLSGVAVASGTAQFAQQRNAANTKWQYGSVSATGGGGDVQLSTTTINILDVITLSSSTITQAVS